MPLLSCTQLVEVKCVEESSDMQIRDLLKVLPLNEARLLLQAIGESNDDLWIRDISGLDIRDLLPSLTEVQSMREIKDEAFPDLREILERLRLLNGLDVAPLFKRYHLRLAELYYRKGRRTEFAPLKQMHLENKQLERRYRSLKAQLKEAHEQNQRNLKEQQKQQQAQQLKMLQSRQESINSIRRSLREEKRIWVLTENHLGDMREGKTKMEAFFESMRLKLLSVLRQPARYLQDPARFQKLEQRILVLNQELERDNDLHREILNYTKHTEDMRRAFNHALTKAEKKLPKLIALPIASPQKARQDLALSVLLNNAKAVLGDSISTRSVPDLVLLPVARLDETKALATPGLYRTVEAKCEKQAAQVEVYARSGYAIDLGRVSNPHTLASILIRNVSGLLPPAFLALANEQENLQARVYGASLAAKLLTKAQQQTIKLVTTHIKKVIAAQPLQEDALLRVFSETMFETK